MEHFIKVLSPFSKVNNSSGVLCPKREIEGCFSLECQRNGRSGKSFWGVHLVFLSSAVCHKNVFFVDTIIELLLRRSGDIIKFVAGPLADVSCSFPVAQMVEHGASNAKIMGSIPRESKS